MVDNSRRRADRLLASPRAIPMPISAWRAARGSPRRVRWPRRPRRVGRGRWRVVSLVRVPQWGGAGGGVPVPSMAGRSAPPPSRACADGSAALRPPVVGLGRLRPERPGRPRARRARHRLPGDISLELPPTRHPKDMSPRGNTPAPAARDGLVQIVCLTCAYYAYAGIDRAAAPLSSVVSGQPLAEPATPVSRA